MRRLETTRRPGIERDLLSVGDYLTDGWRLLYVADRFMDGSEELLALEDCRSFDVVLCPVIEVLTRFQRVSVASPAPAG